MIFKQFDQTDIVAGRTSTVTSGIWPSGLTFWTSSQFEDNYWELTQSIATPSPSYGASIYDIRSTMYYLDVYPSTYYHQNNDPYFSVAYGNYYGELGSGSFNLDTASIKAFAAKAVYTQYRNILLGTADVGGMFSFKSGSTSTDGESVFILNLSSYKMKDRCDEGLFEITLTGSRGSLTLRDDSPFLSQASSVYQLVRGSINDATSTLPTYEGIGLLYPANGIAVFNANVVNNIVGLDNVSGSALGAPVSVSPANYSTSSIIGVAVANQTSLIPATVNHKVFFWSMQNAGGTMKIRKSEYVPARHYFVRVKNRDFNYSNNPTYVYDGTDGVHAKGTIYNEDFITDPRTYITTVGLYNDNNELVAVAKLSRPALKSFDSELLIKVRLDF